MRTLATGTVHEPIWVHGGGGGTEMSLDVSFLVYSKLLWKNGYYDKL